MKIDVDNIWEQLQTSAIEQKKVEPLLADFFQHLVLNHDSLISAMSFLLAEKLQSNVLSADKIFKLCQESLSSDSSYIQNICADLIAINQRDSACVGTCHAFCFYKGFHALLAYRVMHHLWQHQQKKLALQLQQRSSVVFDVDIHPAAVLGQGIMLDHATGIVIGETARVGNNVSLMQGVTLGGTGKAGGDRHPKISDGVLISVGAAILGNINIGEGVQVTAGSVVLKSVPAHTTVAGVPAVITGKPQSDNPSLVMNHSI